MKALPLKQVCRPTSCWTCWCSRKYSAGGKCRIRIRRFCSLKLHQAVADSGRLQAKWVEITNFNCWRRCWTYAPIDNRPRPTGSNPNRYWMGHVVKVKWRSSPFGLKILKKPSWSKSRPNKSVLYFRKGISRPIGHLEVELEEADSIIVYCCRWIDFTAILWCWIRPSRRHSWFDQYSRFNHHRSFDYDFCSLSCSHPARKR